MRGAQPGLPVVGRGDGARARGQPGALRGSSPGTTVSQAPWRLVPMLWVCVPLVVMPGLCLGVRGVDHHKPAAGVEVYACDPGRGDAGRDGRWRYQGL